MEERKFDKSRFVGSDSISTLIGLAMMLYSIPRECAKEVEALVSVPGMGEFEREHQAIKMWGRDGVKAKCLLLTGQGVKEPFENPTRDELLKPPHNLSIDKLEGIHWQDGARWTNDQARWVVEMAGELGGFGSLAVFTSPYHILRTCMGFVKAFFDKTGSLEDVPVIIPAPALVAPTRIIPNGDYDGWEAVAGELERISKYEQFGLREGEAGEGWIVTLDQMKEYLDILWESGRLQALMEGC